MHTLHELAAVYSQQPRRLDLYPFVELRDACADFTNPEFALLQESGNSPGVTRDNLAERCRKAARTWLAKDTA